MQFCIQDPSYDNSKYLLETLLAECISGCAGAGMYAFATKDGIELFLKDKNFKNFIQKSTFLLIVGMDDITNVHSIETLKELQKTYGENLRVKAYIHNNRKSTFHPKLSWFRKKEGGVLILGSGNLTQQGLRQNREVFTVNNCDENTIDKVIEEWNQWLEHSKPFLFDISDDVVMQCAKQNAAKLKTVFELKKIASEKNRIASYSALAELFKIQPKDKIINNEKSRKVINSKDYIKNSKANVNDLQVNEDDIDIDLEYWFIDLQSEVLFAEIPKNGYRMSQLNFDKKSFEDFFGATCGENGIYRILFRNINSDGSLKKIEVRQSVSVESHNYRFELDAAKGVIYPQGNERPIGVFAKVSDRDFLYEIIMPNNQVYQQVASVMNSKQSNSRALKRLTYICSEIYKDTSDLAIWKRLDIEDDE